ncbi:MAG: 3-isopropylmalate dehydratase small subunit [Trueperaceae bacterium]
MNGLPPVRSVRGTAVVVPGNDVDTDRIVPARYLKCVTFDALGPQLFYDERYDENGAPKDHPLNRPGADEAKILICGANFGCGSSREHAPQSIHKAGFRALIGGSFAEIFFGNATTLGMPCVTLDPEGMASLRAAVQREPELEVEVNVEARQVRAGEHVFPAHLPDGTRGALLEGRWDALTDLLTADAEIEATARRLGYLPSGA